MLEEFPGPLKNSRASNEGGKPPPLKNQREERSPERSVETSDQDPLKKNLKVTGNPEDPVKTGDQDQKVYSVSQINRVIKKQLEGQHQRLWVRGEISNFKAHSSGHYYFSLKDSGSQINGVMFRSYNSKLRFQPENGMEVTVFGKISVYEPRGQYQVFCENMEPVGAGAMARAFEQLKKKLRDQGLFDKDKKQSLPLYPREVAVITSPTGAAIEDILNVLTRRSQKGAGDSDSHKGSGRGGCQ